MVGCLVVDGMVLVLWFELWLWLVVWCYGLLISDWWLAVLINLFV